MTLVSGARTVTRAVLSFSHRISAGTSRRRARKTMPEEENDSTPFTLALIAGGIAGTTVDVALYPLDALKTRLQSPHGFWKAGGFSGIYRGVLATALGASPGSAMFFSACACRPHTRLFDPTLPQFRSDNHSPINFSLRRVFSL